LSNDVKNERPCEKKVEEKGGRGEAMMRARFDQKEKMGFFLLT
jgi:hypothetical protein